MVIFAGFVRSKDRLSLPPANHVKTSKKKLLIKIRVRHQKEGNHVAGLWGEISSKRASSHVLCVQLIHPAKCQLH